MSDFEILRAVAPKVIVVIVPMLVAFALLERFFFDKRDAQNKDKEPKRD